MNSRLKIDTTNALAFIAGLLGPLGFAPFHLPGMLFLSIAIFYALVDFKSDHNGLKNGFFYGLGYFGFGVSWIIVSIHDYGQMNYLIAALLTLLFVSYLALFPALTAYGYTRLITEQSSTTYRIVLFSCLWCLFEYARSFMMTGFPWLLVGTATIDTPLKFLIPWLGVYGVSLYAVFCSCLIITCLKLRGVKHILTVSLLIGLILSPSLLQHIQWTQKKEQPVSIGAVQANLSMRDKWDEALYYQLLKVYANATKALLGTDVIILPESALPLPSSYLSNYLDELHYKALKGKSALLLGILQPSNAEETYFYNAMISLGAAKGAHIKNHLVPFGEYIPKPFARINHWLNLPEPNVITEVTQDALIKVHSHYIASLICYEIAYTALLKKQLPKAEWIVSISDTGWFGKSLASYQQLQMSRVLSLLSGRYHVVVNNGSLSSIIDANGTIVTSLPAFSSGILKGTVYPVTGKTPWVMLGDAPALFFCSIFILFALLSHFFGWSWLEAIAGKLKRGYPKRFL